MRGATLCARRVKALFGSLRSKLGKVSLPGPGDPLTQCILGILSRDVPEPKAREALDRIRGMVVDFNELRVVPPIELARCWRLPGRAPQCEDISRALNKIFALHHNVTLDHLLGMPKKEVIIYLSASTDWRTTPGPHPPTRLATTRRSTRRGHVGLRAAARNHRPPLPTRRGPVLSGTPGKRRRRLGILCSA